MRTLDPTLIIASERHFWQHAAFYNEDHVMIILLTIIKDKGVRSKISIPGSLSFAKLVMMSSAPAKSAGETRYVSQDPFI